MPSGWRGPLEPDGREEFDVQWFVHLYLLTVCVVPFSILEGKKDSRNPLLRMVLFEVQWDFFSLLFSSFLSSFFFFFISFFFSLLACDFFMSN